MKAFPGARTVSVNDGLLKENQGTSALRLRPFLGGQLGSFPGVSCLETRHLWGDSGESLEAERSAHSGGLVTQSGAI